MIQHITILCVLGLLSGCASITVSPPPARDFETSRVYNKSYEEVWLKAVDWFADHNVVIDKLERSSGLITAKYLLDVSDAKYLDHGIMKVRGTLHGYVIEEYGSLNVTIRQLDDSRTKANVNFFGTWELTAQDAWDGRSIARKGKSSSTGILEASVLDYIGFD